MAQFNRPFGRRKNVSSGEGHVFKQGEGLGLGQLGDLLGGDGGSSSGGGRPGMPRGMRAATKGSPLLLVVGLVVYFLLGQGSLGDLLGGAPTQVQSLLGGNSDFKPAASLGVLDRSVAADARDKRVAVAGADSVTLMVYMCGADLESRSGAATADLKEMAAAKLSDKVTILIETGGAKRWHTDGISAKTNTIFKLTARGLEKVEEVGAQSMVKPATMSQFIAFGKAHYPADRYGFIFWDHGGGSLTGFGYDELYPNDSMTLDEISTAFKEGGCTFDFVGFDTCLMATLETALTLEPYADYLIASEETEPGSGWYYTNWMTALCRNPSMATIDLGKAICDDFVSYTRAGDTTLSVIDLAELKGTIPGRFQAFAASTADLIQSESYQQVAQARGGVREFAPQAGIDQVDLIQLAERIGTDEAKAFAAALKSCVKYNTTSASMRDCGGISIYFPSRRLASVDNALSTYQRLGIDTSYSDCIRSYSNVAAGGQLASGQGSSLDSLFGSLFNGGQGSAGNGGVDIGSLLQSVLGGSGSDIASLLGLKSAPSWLDRDLIARSADYYKDNSFDASQLALSDKGSGKVIKLTEAQWALVSEIELTVFVDDGEGYIDLGADNTFVFDDDGELVADYDETWLAIDGHVVSYFHVSTSGTEDDYIITGRVPALLNGQPVELMLQFTDEDEYGSVLGARVLYKDGEPQPEAKGLVALRDGDVLEFICDYYTYDKRFVNNYKLGNPLTVSGELGISNVSIANAKTVAAFHFTDVYRARYWSPALPTD